MKVVSSTPSVANVTPGPIMGFMSWYLVSIPPENKMILKAMTPMNWVTFGLSNCICRKGIGPSHPKNIPTPKNKSNAGRPNL